MSAQILATVLILCWLPAQDSNPQKLLYRPTGQEATLVGTVRFEGTAPQQRVIDMSADLVCARMNQKGMTADVVTTGDKLQNAFVYFKSGDPLRQYAFERSDKPAVLQHKNCFYRPRVLGVRVNQPLRIENNDPTHHNIHPRPTLNLEWNVSQVPNGPALIKSFSRAEIIPVICNQHPWERAFIGVFSDPFFAISDVYGSYEIRGVPPGTYQIVAWHETLGQQEIEITLTAGEVRNMDFVFGRESR
jgi:hypothetical protein